MADLTLTEDEKKASDYLEWDDEALGKLSRRVSFMLRDKKGMDGTFVTAAAQLLVGMAFRANATESEVTLEGMTYDGEPMGDWRVTATKLPDREKTQEQTGDEYED